MIKKRINNKGYTLVELLVVIAIMAIALGLITVSIATVFANNVRSCATDIDAMISRGVVSSNYRNPSVIVEVVINGTNLEARYYENAEWTGSAINDRTSGAAATPGEVKVVGTTNINVSLNGFSTASLPVRLTFDRGTGLMRELITGNPTPQKFPLSAKPTISLGSGSSSIYTVELTPYTGGHEVKRG